MKNDKMANTADIKSWDTLPLILNPAETAIVLGISRKNLYELFGINAIPTVMVGKRRRVPRESLRRWLEG